MNKKGFTLVELLAVLVVLSLVVTLGVFSIMGITKGIKQKAVETKVKNLEISAVEYGQEHTNETNFFDIKCNVDGTDYNFCKKIQVKDLVSSEVFETEETEKNSEGEVVKTVINNLTNESMMNEEITIYRKNNRIYAIFKNNTNARNEYLNQ